MKNPFIYSNSNKRYHSLDYFYKHKFGRKVCKISLNGGFTCPNKDGTKSTGGCIYCSKSGSGDFAGSVNKDIVGQFQEIKELIRLIDQSSLRSFSLSDQGAVIQMSKNEGALPAQSAAPMAAAAASPAAPGPDALRLPSASRARPSRQCPRRSPPF